MDLTQKESMTSSLSKAILDGSFLHCFCNIPLNNYDVMLNLDKGLKWFEGSMGNNIKETGVPFDIDRKLTEAEIAETVKYCVHDVEQTIEVFLQRKEEFNGRLELVKLACKGKPLDLFLDFKDQTTVDQRLSWMQHRPG